MDETTQTQPRTRRAGAGRPPRFSREEAQELRRRRSEGISFDVLKEETGTSVATLRKVVNGEGAYADTF